MRKIWNTVLTMLLYRRCWNNIAWKYRLVNVVQIGLRQCCTRKLLAQFWPWAHRYTFAGKPTVSNKSGGLFFKREQYHRKILALFVQHFPGNPFTACGTMTRGPTLTETKTLIYYFHYFSAGLHPLKFLQQ